MSDIKLGELPKENAERDAIHVAVIPMLAHGTLFPGQRVGIVENGWCGASKKEIGIVDPFLSGQVLHGNRVWVMLFQNTVTGFILILTIIVSYIYKM